MNILVLGQVDPYAINTLNEMAKVYTVAEDSINLTNETRDFEASSQLLIFRSPFKINASRLNRMPILKNIIRVGSGIDGVDISSLASRSISLQLVQADGSAVAELAIGNLISLLRNTIRGSLSLAAGKWNKSQLVGKQLSGSTALIVGFGNVGRSLSRMLSGFGVNVLVVDRSPSKVGKVQAAAIARASFVELDFGLKIADFVFLCCPLTENTKGLLDYANLSLMKNTAVLINVARAQIVDNDALVELLDKGKLYGACVDVFESEPPSCTKFLNHPRILVTPHLGAQTYETHASLGKILVQKVREIINNEQS